MYWLLFGLVVAALWEGRGDPLDGLMTLLNEITRGRRVTHARYGADGVVDATPQDLADQAGVDLDTYALARMLSSEEGSSSNLIKAAIAWAAVNHARRQGQSIAELLLHATDPDHSGYFGTFKNIDKASAYYREDDEGRPTVADRYASTALDPYQGDIDIALAVEQGRIADLTSGADQYDRPGGERNPAAVAAKRTAGGSVPVVVAGIDPDELRFWRHG